MRRSREMRREMRSGEEEDWREEEGLGAVEEEQGRKRRNRER